MVRALSLVTALASTACGGAPRSGPPGSTDPCPDGLRPPLAEAPRSLAELPDGRVERVVVAGLRSVPEGLVREQIRVSIGEPLDPDVVRADLRRILALPVFEDARVDAERDGEALTLRYELVERPLVRSVRVSGAIDEVGVGRLAHVAGEVFVPSRIHRLAAWLAAEHRRAGYAAATARAGGGRLGDDAVDVCFDVSAGRRWAIDRVEVAGNERIEDGELLALVRTFEGRANAAGGIYRADLLAEDLDAIERAYHDRGMILTRVGEPETEWDDDRLVVRIPVEESPVYRLGAVSFEGELTVGEDEYRRLLGVRTGDAFSRRRVVEGMARVREHERRVRPGVEADLTPTTEVDEAGRVVHLEIEIEVRGPTRSIGGATEDPAPALELRLTDDELVLSPPPPPDGGAR